MSYRSDAGLLRYVTARAIPTTGIDVVRVCFLEAIARGQEPAALCARYGVSPEQLADAEARLPSSLTHRIWQDLADLLGGSDFGLCVARRAEAASAFGILGHVARSAKTIGDGMRWVGRPPGAYRSAVTGRGV
jgi:hypothetical protein